MLCALKVAVLLCVTADLEIVPPGFREGMKFDGDQAVTVSQSNRLSCARSAGYLTFITGL